VGILQGRNLDLFVIRLAHLDSSNLTRGFLVRIGTLNLELRELVVDQQLGLLEV
jgi:hypothetical protein